MYLCASLSLNTRGRVAWNGDRLPAATGTRRGHNGFEPIPKRKIQLVKKAWITVYKGKVSMWWICGNEK